LYLEYPIGKGVKNFNGTFPNRPWFSLPFSIVAEKVRNKSEVNSKGKLGKAIREGRIAAMVEKVRLYLRDHYSH
jgi:hypothetical protein